VAILLNTLYHYTALFGAYAVLSLAGMFIVCVALYGRTGKPASKPQAICQCGDPACTAFALLNGKWPKYQRPYSEREAMRIAKLKKAGVA